MREVVVDASVVLKWVVDEPGTDAALEFLDGEGSLHAPDFMLLEVANVLWAKVRRRVLSRPHADAAWEALAATPLALAPAGGLIEPARALAFALDLTLYDAVYVALAERRGCPLATADARLARAMAASGLRATAHLVGS